MRNAYKILFGDPEVKRPLGRSKHGGENKVKISFKETASEDVDWLYLIKYRGKWWVLVSKVKNLRVP
jgi:hypothetical protein